MSSNLTVFVNDQPVFEYDRETQLEDKQIEFLDKMDSDMGRGVKINGELFSPPDAEQRAKFVAMNLLRALKQEDDARIAVACAYLIHRRPLLIEVHAKDLDGRVIIDLVDEQVS